MSQVEECEASPKRKHRDTIGIRRGIRITSISAVKDTSIA